MKSSITFYQRFVTDILAGKKTITIRNEMDKDFAIGSVIKAWTYEENIEFAMLKILSINPILLSELNEVHAQQENMSLKELKKLIAEIYPHSNQFYIITFQRENYENHRKI